MRGTNHFIAAAKESLKHFRPKWVEPWLKYIKGTPTVQKLLVIIVLGVSTAFAGFYRHERRAQELLQANVAQEHKGRLEAETKLAPFWAAGDRLFGTNVRRLELLLDALTNSLAGQARIESVLGKAAALDVMVIKESLSDLGQRELRAKAHLKSNSLVIVPVPSGKPAIALRFVLQNIGDLPAEAIKIDFDTDREQPVITGSGSDWKEVSDVVEMQPKVRCLITYIPEALHPRDYAVAPPVWFEYVQGTVQIARGTITLRARAASETHIPFAFAFVPSTTNAPAFIADKLSDLDPYVKNARLVVVADSTFKR